MQSLSTAARARRWLARGVVLGLSLGAGGVAATSEACIELYRKGVMKMPFNASFLHVGHFRDEKGQPRDALLMSSFYNVEKDAAGARVERFTHPDRVAWIPDLDALDPANFDPATELEVLSDRNTKEPVTVWPNETEQVPDGVLPFQGVIVPGGFLSTERPGRLTVINVDDPKRTEYVIAGASDAVPVCKDGQVENERWYYHGAVYIDMDDDGLKDIITARASLMPYLHGCPPSGQLVWFKNPGKDMRPDEEWEAHVLAGPPFELDGPEINITSADLDGDGVPEVIATHFFTSDHITVFGAPAGGRWSDVASGRQRVRRNTIMTNQGRPFAVQAADLDMDGRLEVITSNHQGDGCFDVTSDEIPGRVIALVQPESGRIFDDPWSVRVLKDDIRPNPTFPAPARGPGRLAPNRATAFWPVRSMQGRERPWILVGGDEASKIWVLKPPPKNSRDPWAYESYVVFDINEHYGPNATQTLLDEPRGVSISTIGGMALRYDRPGPDGHMEIYAPVFEARHIHVFSFREGSGEPVRCTADTVVGCPTD